MTTLDTLAYKLAQATEELYAGCPTDAMRTLTKVCKTKWDTNIEPKGLHVSCSLDKLPERTRAELTLRFIELAQRDLELYRLDGVKSNLALAVQCTKDQIRHEQLEFWK